MSVNTATNINLEFLNLKSRNFSLKTKYNEQHKKMEDSSHIIKEQFELTDNTFYLMEKTVDKLNIMEEDLKTTKEDLKTTKEDLKTTKEDLKTTKEDLKTSKEDLKTTKEDLNTRTKLMENKVNELMEMKIRTELYRTYRDWIKRFFEKLINRLGGKDVWYDVKEAIADDIYHRMDISERKCIQDLNKILESINMDIGEFKLLLEMTKASNSAFHNEWPKVSEAKEGLTKEFPSDMEKYKNPLFKLLDSQGDWRTWRKTY